MARDFEHFFGTAQEVSSAASARPGACPVATQSQCTRVARIHLHARAHACMRLHACSRPISLHIARVRPPAPPGSQPQVREAFAVFDHDGDGRITLQNMVDTVVRIYKVRGGQAVAGSSRQ